MNSTQLQVDPPPVQAAIYRVALSMDAFLVNGIPYGLLQRAGFNCFLQKTANNVLRDLANLDELTSHAPAASQPQVAEVLAALRTRCQQLIDLVTGLGEFRNLPLHQVRSTVSQIPIARGECQRKLQELESAFHTPKSFYQSRPELSTANVDAFLENLDHAFVEEWKASADNGADLSLSAATGPRNSG